MYYYYNFFPLNIQEGLKLSYFQRPTINFKLLIKANYFISFEYVFLISFPNPYSILGCLFHYEYYFIKSSYLRFFIIIAYLIQLYFINHNYFKIHLYLTFWKEYY